MPNPTEVVDSAVAEDSGVLCLLADTPPSSSGDAIELVPPHLFSVQ